MRIKIIGENNCARATRHLLRMAGFAVTEFLPAEAITQAPHHGYAITIETGFRAPHGGVRGDLSPAQLTPDASRKTLEVNSVFAPGNRANADGPASMPDLPTHGQPAWIDEGASAVAKAAADASAVVTKPGAMADGSAFFSKRGAASDGGGTHSTGFSLCGVLERRDDGREQTSGTEKGSQAEACATGGERGGGAIGGDGGSRSTGFSLCGVLEQRDDGREQTSGTEKGSQAEACATQTGEEHGSERDVVAVGGQLGASIHFDSVEGALEGAVLRHVAQLVGAPVILDRPGGLVHSDRELRIILPFTGNVKADERAAVSVEFGVLRGMLDLVTPPSTLLKDKSETGSGGAQSGGKKNLWTMFRAAARAARSRSGVFLLAGPLLAGALLGSALLTFAGRTQASPRPGSPAATPTLARDRQNFTTGRHAFAASKFNLTAVRLTSHTISGVLPAARVALPAPWAALRAGRPGSHAFRVVEARGVDGAYLRLEAALAPAPAQGQFAAGQLNIALIGGAAVSSSLYDSGNTALKVNCVVGCGAISTFSDNAAFSAGSTAVNNISAVFNDSIAALTSGDAGAVRSTSDRMLYVNVGKLGGTALSGANVVDSGNTAFRVNCVVGCTVAGGFTDNSAFTAGTTTESSVGGVYNDGLSTLTSGNGAAARITASRALHVNLRNASGTEIGTASNPVRVDPVGTTTQPVSLGSLPALPAGTNTIGSVKVTDGTNTIVVDPCKGQTKSFVSINQTTNAQLASGTASKKIYICSIHVVVAAATNVALVEGTGSVCATGTAGVSGFGGATAATGWNFAANGGIAMGNGDSSLGAEGTAADNLCVYNSGSGQVSGGVSYVVQ